MPELTPAQRAVIDDKGGALLVSAAAGSGKTFVLVKRLLGQLTDEHDPASVTDYLIITFTKAAAAELRAKITDEIKNRLASSPGNRHLQKQLTLIHAAKITTIHAFCSSVIKENAHLADISPDFRIADESECAILKAKALDELLEARYAAIGSDPDFALLVENLSGGVNDKRLCEVVLDAYEKVMTHADPLKWMSGKLGELSGPEEGENPWAREIIESCLSNIRYWNRRYCGALAAMAGIAPLESAYAPAFQRDLDMIRSFETALETGWDEARCLCNCEFEKLKPLRNFDDEDLKESLQATRNGFKNAFKKLAAVFDVSTADIRADIRCQYPLVKALFALLRDFDAYYAAEKRRRGTIDYSDLEHLCIRLLTDEKGGPTALARDISGRFREIMVDEYQDTNDIQDKIINAISKNGQNLFMVGDVKQSIYRFRLADPTIFLDKYLRFPDSKDAPAGEGRKIILSQNFRSRAGILKAVNELFENVMSTEFGEMAYGADEMLYYGTEYPAAEDERVEVDIVDMASAEDEDLDRPEAEAAFTANRIAELLAKERIYDSATGGTRPIEPGDIVILMRSPSGKADIYRAELQKRGIPVSFEGGGESLLDTAEARLLIALLEVIDNPRQDIPLIAVLKSPLFGFTSDDLAKVRLALPEGDFYQALKILSKTDEKCLAFINTLESLRTLAADLTADELVWALFARTDMPAICSAMENGAIRRKNLLLLYEYARQFEASGYRGLFGFVSRLRRMKEQGCALSGASEAGEGNAVTIMSIHKSKGLEFPVVFVCDLSKQFNLTDLRRPLLMHRELGVGANIRDLDKMIEYPSVMRAACELRMRREVLAEELRVLYVAMTRAKERLIMTASFAKAQNELKKCYLESDLPVEPQLLLSSNCMAKWLLCVLMKLPAGRRLLGYDVGGGQEGGGLWKLNLITPGEGGAKLEVREEKTDAPDQWVDLKARFAYAYPHEKAVGLPSKLTATYLKGRYMDAETSDNGQILWTGGARGYKRPAFAGQAGLTVAEAGTAAHLVMQYIDFDRCRDNESTAEQIRELYRAQIITGQQTEAVDPGMIRRFFESPVGRRLTQASGMIREFKFSLLAPAGRFFEGAGEDGLLLQGVVDCCFEEGGGLVLVDFKTDRIAPGQEKARAESYRTQMEVYAYALERIMQKPVGEKLLYFFATGETAAIE